MRREEIIAKLRAHEQELRAAGVISLAVFGSAARDEQHKQSDVDVVVRLSEEARRGGFSYFGRLDALSRRLEAILEQQVDVVAEPVSKERLRQSIEKDRVIAF